MSEGKNAVSQTQRERLAYIELRAFFVGEVRRPDIESRFGIKPAAASRDLAAYKELAPDNLEYDTLARCYRPTPKFVPHFGFSPERIMSWLRNGFGDGLDTRSKSPAQCVGPVTLCAPSLDILATITRAICGKRPLRISYISVSSGKSDREVVPVALADTGLRWHVRAFDRRNRRFSDFAIRRIVMAEPGSDPVADEETLAADEQWARMVDMELVPHPRATWHEGIAADFDMVEGVLRVKTRAALAGYFLRRWNVDCSPEQALDPAVHHLWLRNQETLYGVESAALAPGRGNTEQKKKGID